MPTHDQSLNLPGAGGCIVCAWSPDGSKRKDREKGGGSSLTVRNVYWNDVTILLYGWTIYMDSVFGMGILATHHSWWCG